MTAKRWAIWAAVSSRPQAEKDSIEQQLADGRRWVAEQDGELAAELIVPGESRDHIDFYDALAYLDSHLRPGEENPYRLLEQLLANRSIDGLWCRARDRLGRTDALIAGVEERCRRAKVLVYSQQMPPTGQEAGDLYVSAIERAGAQRELIELRRRNLYGMDSRARKGLPLGSKIPFGYRSDFRAQGGRMVRFAIPDPAEAEGYLWAVDATERRSHTVEQITLHFRRLFPYCTWDNSRICYMLRNPFYAGIVLRRRKRQPNEKVAIRVLTPDGPSLIDDSLWPEVEALMLRRAQRGNHSFLDRQGNVKLILLAPGQHEPLIDLARWLRLQSFLELRSEARRPPSISSPWSGLLKCGLCGAPMYFSNSRRNYLYYACARRWSKVRRGPNEPPCVNPPIRLDLVTSQVVEFLRQLYGKLSDEVERTETPVMEYDPLAPLLSQLEELRERKRRLIVLYETNRLTLAEFDERAKSLEQAMADVEGMINEVHGQVLEKAARQERLVQLGGILPVLDEWIETTNPVEVNRVMRGIIRSIVVVDRKVVAVRI